jgi:hypothetical protein
MSMDFSLRPTFHAAGAVIGTVATIAAAYAHLPALAVIGGAAVVANVIGAGVTHSSGGVDTDSNLPGVHRAEDGKARTITPAELKPGDRMKDGTIYAGISPDTGRPMYTTLADAPGLYSFTGAADYARQLNQQRYLGQNGWRVPTKNELNVLFNNRAAIDGFNIAGSDADGWHWSSTGAYGYAWGQRFRDGHQFWDNKTNASSMRCVR